MIKRECSKHNSVFTIRAKYEEEKEEIREEIVKTNISKH